MSTSKDPNPKASVSPEKIDAGYVPPKLPVDPTSERKPRGTKPSENQPRPASDQPKD